MLRFLPRHAKVISLVGGFLFGMVGTVWSFVVVDRLGESMRQLSDTGADLARQIQSLNSIAVRVVYCEPAG